MYYNHKISSTESIILFSANELIKTAIEHGFRYFINEHYKQMDSVKIKNILDLSVIAAQKKLCMSTTPIFLINDLLSNYTIDNCSDIFTYLEDNSNVWKSELFYSTVRNYLLRMCNGMI